MKYMLLIYGNEEQWSSVDPDLMAEVIRETDALNRTLFESGELVGAYGVADQAAAKVVRVTDGVPAVTDGPYAEAKEQLAGFFLVDCATRQRAEEIAAHFAQPGGTVELRPAMWGDGDDA
jgi:hypothetical protein